MSECYTIVVEQGQDIFDLAIQEYGSVESLFVLLADNRAIDLTTELASGATLQIQETPDTTDIPDLVAMKWFRNNQVRVRNNAGEAEPLLPNPPAGFTEGFTTGYDS